MKCDFSATPAMIAVQYMLDIALILGIGMFFTEASESVVTYVIFALIIMGLILVSNLKKGIIKADEENVQISRYLFGRKVLKKSIAYYDIDTAECRTDLETGRYGFIRYRLVTTIKENDGNERTFYTNLRIPKDMPVQEPDKYKIFIETHPVMELSGYINKKIRQDVMR